MGHTREEKTVMKNAAHAQRAKVADEAARAMAKDCDRRIYEMRCILRSARRYVSAYSENDNNHPQARDLARQLLGDIDTQLD